MEKSFDVYGVEYNGRLRFYNTHYQEFQVDMAWDREVMTISGDLAVNRAFSETLKEIRSYKSANSGVTVVPHGAIRVEVIEFLPSHDRKTGVGEEVLQTLKDEGWELWPRAERSFLCETLEYLEEILVRTGAIYQALVEKERARHEAKWVYRPRNSR